MNRKEEIEEQFRSELNELLEKYKAEIELNQRGHDFMHYDVIQVTIGPKYDENGKCIIEYTEFDL